jgi:2-oxoglutarate ferredoxin oxidoreductase subunit delta
MEHPEKCSGCDLCGMYCPDFAIFGYKEKEAAAAKEQAAKQQAMVPPVSAAEVSSTNQEVDDAR